jgi:septal ring factor EnvC (AmiA/AmiB activator)
MTLLRRHHPAWLLVCSILLVIILGWPARADDIDRQRRNLREIQGRIERLSQQLASSKQREGAVKDELGQLEKELADLEKNSRRLEKRLRKVKEQIKEKERSVDLLKRDIADREQYVKRRLGALYRRGEMRLFKVLFEKESPSRVAENYFYLSRLVREDRKLLNGFRDDWRALQSTLAELEDLRSGQQKRLDVIDAGQKTLKKGRKTRQAVLRSLKDSRETLSKQITELKEKARRLRGLLKTLESEKTGEYSGPSAGFKRQKGTLPWPGDGALMVRFGTNFNEQVGSRIESQGIELAQNPGTPMHAVAKGKVIFAKPFRGFGNLLILDHGDGYYTLYAQARQLLKKVGDIVDAGERIGLSGFGGSDTIYFEIRQRGKPLDPLQWLKTRR